MPGETLRFKAVTLEAAHQALREENDRLDRMRRAIDEQE
jgi:allophanate hydrolase subunit 2